MPKVSVITSAYNCESFIKDSIDSMLNQSFEDFEFIIVNDGSTDKTSEIINTFKDKRIIFIDNKKNKGVMLCSREAISVSSSKYIAIHDADDVSLVNRLELQYNFLENNDDIFCVGGWAKKIDSNGCFIGDWNFPPLEHKDIVTMLVIYSKCPIINPTSMYRRSGYDEINGYSPSGSIKFTHDLDFWCRAILSNKKFANLKEYLINYRVNPQGMSRKGKFSQITDHNKVMNEFKKRIKDVKF